VQAIRDFKTNENDKSLLNFKKNEIIKLNNNANNVMPPKGWQNGILNEKKGLFPSEYVRPIDLNCDLRKDTTKLSDSLVLSSSSSSAALVDSNSSSLSQKSSNNNNNNNYYSMMEFAMLNFKSSLKYLEK
jgi:hypothetical protein